MGSGQVKSVVREPRPMYAKLDGHTVVICTSLAEWLPWGMEHLEHGDGKSRQVAFDQLDEKRIDVSTVFVGLNVGILDGPKWFETAVFCDKGYDDPLHGQRQLYATWEEAESGHASMVAAVFCELARRKENS